jgi:hypothetical protein
MSFVSFIKGIFGKPLPSPDTPNRADDMTRDEFNRLIPSHYRPIDLNRGSIFAQSEMKQRSDGRWENAAQRDQRRGSNRYRPGIDDRE